MKRKKSAKRGRASGTATEHAASGPGKDTHFELMHSRLTHARATKQQPKRKHRFINMSAEQLQRRAGRVRKRTTRAKQRRNKKKRKQTHRAPAKDVAAERQQRKARPCCGRYHKNCSCQPPKGMKKMQLTALAKRFAETALCTAADTTDVSAWQHHMQHATEQLPLRVLLAYAHTHVVFNQESLLKAFIERKAFLFKTPWFNWQLLQSIVEKHKAAGNVWRSSNYYSSTLTKLLPQNHLGAPGQIPANAVARDVLACRIVGVDAMPAATCDLYDAQPSRDLWKAIMVTWLENVHKICTGCFSDCFLKCTLDRWFAVRTIDHGTISWWPLACPAYRNWYKRLYPGRALSSEEKFQVLCKTYITLNQYKSCTFTDALAQTCWRDRDMQG